jgi:hypothetical protein
VSTDAGVRRPPDALARYLRDHYSASRGGLDLFRRSARGQSGAHVRRELTALADQEAEDRAALLAIMVGLGIDRSPWQERAVALAERAGRLKPNGSLLQRSRLSDYVELEALTAAVHAKALGWRSLRTLADLDARLPAAHLDHLLERAQEQTRRLERLRLDLAPDVLLPDRTVEDRP